MDGGTFFSFILIGLANCHYKAPPDFPLICHPSVCVNMLNEYNYNTVVVFLLITYLTFTVWTGESINNMEANKMGVWHARCEG